MNRGAEPIRVLSSSEIIALPGFILVWQQVAGVPGTTEPANHLRPAYSAPGLGAGQATLLLLIPKR